MSASSRLLALARGAPTLWITTRRRALAAVVAAVLVLVPAVAFELSHPWRLMSLGRPRPDTDRETEVVASLARARAADVDVVLLLGGSTAREFTGSDAHVSDLLTRRCGRSLRFINAGTSSQTLAESWALAEAIPRTRRRLLVVGMNYLRLEESYLSARSGLPIRTLPFASPPALGSALAEAGRPATLAFPSLKATAWVLRAARRFDWRPPLSSRAAFVAEADPAPVYLGTQNLYRPPALSRAEKDRIVRHLIVERLDLFRAVHGEATTLWALFARAFDGKSSRVLFLALPESASMEPFGKLAGPTLEHDLAELQARGALIADWRNDKGLAEDDFYDQQHLLATGRARIEGRFIELLARSTPGCRP